MAAQVVALLLRSRAKATEPLPGWEQEHDFPSLLNRVLPDTIRVLGWADVPQDFHARQEAPTWCCSLGCLRRDAAVSAVCGVMLPTSPAVSVGMMVDAAASVQSSRNQDCDAFQYDSCVNVQVWRALQGVQVLPRAECWQVHSSPDHTGSGCCMCRCMSGSAIMQCDCDSITPFCRRLDIPAMQQAAKHLLGEHDFRNFCKMDVQQVNSFRCGHCLHVLAFLSACHPCELAWLG